jgi:hypothetical protein
MKEIIDQVERSNKFYGLMYRVYYLLDVDFSPEAFDEEKISMLISFLFNHDNEGEYFTDFFMKCFEKIAGFEFRQKERRQEFDRWEIKIQVKMVEWFMRNSMFEVAVLAVEEEEDLDQD